MPSTPLARAQALSERLLSARRAHRRAEHDLAVLLAEMEDHDLHRELGHASIEEYARVVLDLEGRRARDLLRIGRKLPTLPELADAMAAGELDWTKARELVRVATPSNVAAWVARAKALTSRELEREVAHTSAGEPSPDGEPARAPCRRRVSFEMEAADAEVLFEALRIARARAGEERGDVEDGALLADVARRFLAADPPDGAASEEVYKEVLVRCDTCSEVHAHDAEVSDTVAGEAACDALVVDMRPGPKQGHVTHEVPPSVRERVLFLDGGRCTVPGCQHRSWLQIHHLLQRALGGSHHPWNLTSICFVHHRMVHDGVLAIWRDAEGRIVVQDRRGVRRATHVGRRDPAGMAIVPPVWPPANSREGMSA
ncbi:MAG: HNH endonuclease signature motif containing protein [Myxococcota bacterium]